MPVTASIGDYRAGDLLWLERLAPDRFGDAINRDVLVPRPAGRFLFARLIGREEGKLHLLPLTSGARQTVVAAPPWIGVATTLRSEEHTSELQSLMRISYAVFCLKNKKIKNNTI